MSPQTINAIRDLAVTHEAKNLQVAYELMDLAHKARPAGDFIKRKKRIYKRKLQDALELSKLIEKKEIAIIPIGFRCYTSTFINQTIGISTPSFPFTSGFFSPASVTSVFRNPVINLKCGDNGQSHAICIKTENYQDERFGKGIQFTRSTYDEINSLAKTRDQKGINKFLDSTFGYYTLDNNHKFLLAHYNWHPFSDESKSKGITDPVKNLGIINTTLNRRIDRMLKLCDQAKYVIFISHESQNYKYLKIDEEYFHLDDYKELDDLCIKKYGDKYHRLESENIKGPDDILKIYRMGNMSFPKE